MLTCQKDLFSIPSDRHYLNCAYMSPLSKRVVAAGVEGVGRKAMPADIVPEDFFSGPNRARALFADLIGAPMGKYNVPVYAAVAPKLFGRRWVLSIGMKPDTTITFDLWREGDGPTHDEDGKRLRPNDGCHVGDLHWGFPEISFTNRKLKPGE